MAGIVFHYMFFFHHEHAKDQSQQKDEETQNHDEETKDDEEKDDNKNGTEDSADAKDAKPKRQAKSKAKAASKPAMKRPAAKSEVKEKPKKEESPEEEKKEESPEGKADKKTTAKKERTDKNKSKKRKAAKEEEAEKKRQEEEQKKKKPKKEEKKDLKKKETNTGKNDKNEEKPSKKKQELLEKAKKLEISSEENSEEEDAEEDQAAEEYPIEKRDATKAYHFRKLLGGMPQEIQELFKSNSVSRKDKTALVNNGVVKDEQGEWKMNLESPQIQAISKHYSSVKGKDKIKGLPKALMVAKLGGQSALDRAIEDGDVYVVNEKGRDFYVFQSLEITKEQGTTSTAQASQTKVDVDDKQFGAFTAFVDAWQPGYIGDLSITICSQLSMSKISIFNFPFSISNFNF